MAPEHVDYPNSTRYEQSSNNYFTQQQRGFRPACYVRPHNATEVSVIMKILVQNNATFNVKSGGFSRFAGASSINGGVLIDLSRMNSIKTVMDGSSTMVGPAARYYDIYRIWDDTEYVGFAPKNSDLTVAGYVLGCGFSFIPHNAGFACDDVFNFEVVSAKGEILRVNRREHKELFSAIRGGGGSSFGIITRFHIARFSCKKAWWQHLLFPASMNEDLMKVYAHMAKKVLGYDLTSHSFLMSTYSEFHGDYVTEVHLVTEGIDTEHHHHMPALAKPFQLLPGALRNITEANGEANFTTTFSEPAGFRRSAWSTSVGVDRPKFLAEILSNWQALDKKLKNLPNQKGFRSELEFQPVSERLLWNTQRSRHNALRLPASMGPMIFVLLSVQWADSAFDDIMDAECKRFIDQIDETAKIIDQYCGFIHMNYAHPSQDFWGRLSPKSYDRLMATAKKYDPDRALNRLWRGYFKFDEIEG
ncbi:hypothetical protein M441DRAFT_152668 [Trichoderma asperellum CBS 433.97]|uniref:FAD-binding PCMH-type domain-containing protein n=2 Tax=Trichoderma asperellum TaxID=101201 RepID=A0A2T3YTK5_TRIA4|nr:hypothetical protein M441DRAFT_152668 [Trichoderma asperellum CBS 433.97]PTB35836.1 hypothetical protein M441DRAFT_152668 [Trichoderma asperellum CBS 433.97]